MKVVSRRVPVDGVRYDGTAKSIQEIRRIIIDTVGEDFVDIQHNHKQNSDCIEVDNVLMLDFQRLYIHPPNRERVHVPLGSWVVTFLDRYGKPSQVLVMPDHVFHGNFEPYEQADLSQSN